METLKIISIVILVIIALPLIIALFIKKSYSIERETIINKPKQFVFEYIKFLKNQNKFSKWASMDPEMKLTFSGTDGSVGFISAWDSDKKNVGKGEQTIKSIAEGEKIEYDIHFIKPFEGKAIASMTTIQISDNLTKVTWQLQSSMNYPMNFMLLFMNMEKMIGDDLSVGLANLKKILEQ